MADGLVSFFVIWNPTTREYKVLPNSPTRVTNHYSSIYSFGYDYKNDDYKLVKGDFIQDGSVKLPPREEDVYVSEVYSLRVSGVLVNGLRHWLAKRKNGIKGLREQFIISFDFSEERFKQMQLPKGFQDDRPLHTVGVWEECLCVVHGVWDPCNQLEIWVMQDYGVRESWNKRFVIHLTEHRQIFDLYPLRVIWSFKDDKIPLLKTMDERQFVLYDPKKDTITSSSVAIRAAENYVESLVSLNSGIAEHAVETLNLVYVSMAKLKLGGTLDSTTCGIIGEAKPEPARWLFIPFTAFYKTTSSVNPRKLRGLVVFCYVS
ncbi:F-box/kelch-repeat protein At3g06240-like [Papaver somniferum]|uniref:F-box/kelch-repeat protein At3g06240-like n=1 Tax=Papaver somniferum TaxID=3469 RepID=UPI000E70368A|nr:F-box/kelch-repeat protein At3g06240-like [Papaver somniferum]